MIKFYKVFKYNINNIGSYYTNLIKMTKESKYIHSINEWIVDNFPTIVEKRNELGGFFSDRENTKNMKKYGENLYKMLNYILAETEMKFDYNTFFNALNKYQSKFTYNLSYVEICLIKPIINWIVINELSKLCDRERLKMADMKKADEIILLLKNADWKNIDLDKIFKKDSDLIDHPVLVNELICKLNEEGSKAINVTDYINHTIDINRCNLKSIIKTVQNTYVDEQMRVSSYFKILKFIENIEDETVIEKLSVTEKLLESDPIYSKMNVHTKRFYRSKIIKISKKKKINESVIASNLIRNYNSTKEHIGFGLFKEKNYNLRAKWYVGVICSLTIVLWLIITISFRNWFLLAAILFLIPISEIVIQIVNKSITIFSKAKPLFKMDFTKEIPEEFATIVVIPTIIKNTQKIDEMFKQLEKYYLSNKYENLYFGLLGDCAESTTKEMPYDDELVQYGQNKCIELNQKYNKSLFYFNYRKRVFSKTEGKYLGFERKRGALLMLNKILLKTITEEELEKYYLVDNISSINKSIKYVITLDADSELILNSATGMIATMAHPMNTPIIDKRINKVVKGYGMLQPKINIDIESSNKSPYVKLYGGIGGLDSYNPIISNLYQDIFDEGSFMGKGIYDVEVFEKVLGSRLPLDLVLSHDLLESNYLRSGFISDVEIVDDFPSRFLVDMSRQHRWTRGDTQTIPWLNSTVNDESKQRKNNPTTILGKWKIIDNLRRIFLDFSLLGILFMCLLIPNKQWWLLTILGVVAMPLIFTFLEYLDIRKWRIRRKGAGKKSIFSTIFSTIFRAVLSFMLIPYKTFLFLDAFFKSLFRMTISKKNLLNWTTAEDALKTTKNTLPCYLVNFQFNFIIAGILLLMSLICNINFSLLALIFAILFVLAPIVLYSISQDGRNIFEELNDREKKVLKGIAKNTWRYFEDNLKPEYKYLISDNYQNNRERPLDLKTSATDIGFSLTSVICASDLNFISNRKALNYIESIINSIDSLQKWNGHLYNWYSLETFTPMYPMFVSSVDSGNLIASLIVVKEFLIKNNDTRLVPLIEKLIEDADFSVFYTKDNVFSVGYNGLEGELSIYNYNMFASESRLMSFLAIAKGDVPSVHWFSLDKTLTKYKNKKGLASWSGSLFEYYMPAMFMKFYPTTLLEESYDFAYYCQKEYMEEINKEWPWGISECAYDELDDGINYKYKSFSIPYLKMQEEINPRIVISPYSSMLVLPYKPKTVYQNIKKFKGLNMFGKYGLYEAYDTHTKNTVSAYFSHHEGMIMASISNTLLDGNIQNYFSSDINNKAYEILVKEKVQEKPYIDMKIQKYRKLRYCKEQVENDIRAFGYISNLPEVSVISNGEYTVLLNDRGNGFSRFKNIQLNRYRKVTEQDFGTFLYIKDLGTGKFWSNTFAPINTSPDSYEVVFASDKIKYVLTKNDIIATTEIIVTANNMAEIRKITLKNLSKKPRELELTTYLEPTLTENINDVIHRSFNSLFITTSFDNATNSLIAKKKLRNNTKNYYLLHRMFTKKLINSSSNYETIKSNFLGTNQLLSNPRAMHNSLTNSVGTPIDPILSLRNIVKIEKFDSVEIYLVNAFGTSRQQVLDIAGMYSNKRKIDKAFEMSNISNVVKTKSMNLTGEYMRLFNTMLNFLYQTTRINITGQRKELLTLNSLSQSGLWKFGISGDWPIIVIDVDDVSTYGLVKELLKAYEFYKSRGIYIDIVVINNENKEYHDYIKKELELELYRMQTTSDCLKGDGKVFLIDGDIMSPEDKTLFQCVSRLKFDTKTNKSLRECISTMQKENKASVYVESNYQKSITKKYTDNLEFDNKFGGFKNNGKTYVINNIDTPTPWSMILANKNFGSIITNNGGGFSYAYNCQDYKLSSWSNDISSLDQSEGIKINGEKFMPSSCEYDFGYVNLFNKTKFFDETLIEFVPLEDNVKVYLLTLKNVTNFEKPTNISLWLNPVLGNAEEKTSRYILAEKNMDENYLQMRNVYHQTYSDVMTYISSNQKIDNFDVDKLLTKSISFDCTIGAHETKQFIFMLGAERDVANIPRNIKKYSNIDNVYKELENIRAYWKKQLGKIQVSTKDNSLNYMLNGWYLYQTITSRIVAKAGFYQVGGAFGFRDQLQDSMNIASIMPEITKKQIIENASHQFIEGDVCHWWLTNSNFGLRSRYKDDALWLIYATSTYIDNTLDYKILDETVPYITSEVLLNNEHERGVTFRFTNPDTLFNHLLKIVDNALNDLGKHGIPKMGGGDWNDGMNKVGIRGVGESVWLGFFLYDNLTRFIKILTNYKKDFDIQKLINAKILLKENLNSKCFQNDYYVRAFFDNGDILGASSCSECKIDLISQSFAVISGVADSERAKLCLTKVDSELYDKENKIVKLLTPAFNSSANYPGYIMDYPVGIRENGGQYTHSVAWYIMALLKTNNIDKALEVYQMINPINRSLTPCDVQKYKVEPYVIVADIYSNPSNLGRGGWTWYTGSSGWFYRVGIEEILGIKRAGNKLIIDPKYKENFSFIYNYGDTTYSINIIHKKENYSILENGKNINEIVLNDDKKSHKIIITFGENND